MKKPNRRWLLLSLICILLGMILLIYQLQTTPDGGFHIQLYGYGRFYHPGVSSGNYIGMVSFLLMAGGLCGVFMAFRKGAESEGNALQMPKASCILLSLGLVIVGCVFCFLSWGKGIHFGRRYRGLEGPVFIMLGCLVFYRGLQGAEYRFWEKKWEPLGTESEKTVEEIKMCPHCENEISQGEKYCPICGRKM